MAQYLHDAEVNGRSDTTGGQSFDVYYADDLLGVLDLAEWVALLLASESELGQVAFDVALATTGLQMPDSTALADAAREQLFQHFREISKALEEGRQAERERAEG